MNLNYLDYNQPEFLLFTMPFLGLLLFLLSIERGHIQEREKQNEITYIPICKK